MYRTLTGWVMFSKKAIAFSALCMGFFMVILDVTIVNVALPSIAHYFNTTLSKLQWVVAGYTLTFAGLLLLVGSLTDYFGAKIIFQFGLLAFALTSLGCALSPSIIALIFFRLCQGASGALLLPPSLALINVIYQEEAPRARAIGVWAMLGGLACASGPFLGGLLTSLFSWRAVFVVNIFIGLTSLFCVSHYINTVKRSADRVKFDFIGQLLGFSAIFLLAFGLIEVNNYGWASLIIITCFIISAVFFYFFYMLKVALATPCSL